MPPGPAGSSIRISTGPAPDFEALLRDDPFFKQEIANLTTANEQTLARTAEDRQRDESLFALDKALAERTNAQREKYLREFAASRGMVSSGQLGLEQQEREFQFLNNQQQQQTQQDADISGFGRTIENANLAFAQGKGRAAMDTFNRLTAEGRLLAPSVMALWDEESQLYVTANGQYYDAYGNPQSWTRPPEAPPPPGTPPPGEPPPSEPGDPDPYDPYPPSRPPDNPLPGGGVRNPEWPPAAPPYTPPPIYTPPPPPAPPPIEYPPSRPPENPIPGDPWRYE